MSPRNETEKPGNGPQSPLTDFEVDLGTEAMGISNVFLRITESSNPAQVSLYLVLYQTKSR